MERHCLSMAMLAVVFALVCLAGKAESSTGLKFKFYKKTCPSFESVVQRNVNSWYWKNRNSSASLLRFFFNDCFAEGCRGSMTLTNSAQPNLVVLGDIKKELESDKKCKGEVSCADILAMAAVYGLKQVLWPRCGWQPISLIDLIIGASVKKVYRKETLCVHLTRCSRKPVDSVAEYSQPVASGFSN